MCPQKNDSQPTDSPIKKLRLNADLSQEALAEAIGVCISTIRRWEKYNCEPTMTVLQMRNFCQAVGKRFTQLPCPLGNNLTEKRRQAVLDYLRSHPDELNTINLLAAKLDLTRQQTRNAIEYLEFQRLVSREGAMLPNRYGVGQKQFVYKAII